jgi:hypothetical protein
VLCVCVCVCVCVLRDCAHRQSARVVRAQKDCRLMEDRYRKAHSKVSFDDNPCISLIERQTHSQGSKQRPFVLH